MKLAVMMAAWNAEAYVEAAVRSILSQAHEGMSLDIIVVNDGSTDRTGTILHDMADRHACIRVIETENQGVTRARNVALEALAPDTDLVTFLDADDLLPAGRYERDIAVLRADPIVQLTYGNVMLFRQAATDQSGPAPGSETATGRPVSLALGTYRHDLIRRAGGFDTTFRQAEDMDFLLRVFDLVPKYCIQDQVSLYYRRHGSNMTRNTGELRRDFARAVLFSVRRRKAENLPPLPADIFDLHSLKDALEW